MRELGMQFARLTLEICGNNTRGGTGNFAHFAFRIRNCNCNRNGHVCGSIGKCQPTTSSQAVTMTGEGVPGCRGGFGGDLDGHRANWRRQVDRPAPSCELPPDQPVYLSVSRSVRLSGSHWSPGWTLNPYKICGQLVSNARPEDRAATPPTRHGCSAASGCWPPFGRRSPSVLAKRKPAKITEASILIHRI